MLAILTSKWVLLEREHEKLALTLSLFTHFLSPSLQVSYVCSTSLNLAKIFKKEKEINCFICVKTNDSWKFCNYSGWKAFSLQRTLLKTLEILSRDILRNVKDVPKNKELPKLVSFWKWLQKLSNSTMEEAKLKKKNTWEGIEAKGYEKIPFLQKWDSETKTLSFKFPSLFKRNVN